MEEITILKETDMVIRLGLSLVAGGVIGLERASRRQVAGMRTHILICLGATLLMLLSIYLPQEFSSLKNGDPGRIAAQVVSGIGFLGAGAMIRLGNNIKGLTTAASLWLIAAVGLAIGGGMYLAAGVTEVIALLTLSILDHLEKQMFPAERTKVLELNFKEGISDTTEIQDILRSFGVRVQSIDVEQKGKTKGSRLKALVGIPYTTDMALLTKALKSDTNVGKIEMKEKY